MKSEPLDYIYEAQITLNGEPYLIETKSLNLKIDRYIFSGKADENKYKIFLKDFRNIPIYVDEMDWNIWQKFEVQVMKNDENKFWDSLDLIKYAAVKFNDMYKEQIFVECDMTKYVHKYSKIIKIIKINKDIK